MSTGDYQPWNRGWSYRNDGVDIEKNTDAINSNGFHIGFVTKGEWTKYTVQVNENGVYKAKVRLATQENGGEFFFSIEDQEITKTQVVSSTGGWSNFDMHEISDIILSKGEQALKLHFSNDIPFNISSIEFEKIGEIDALELNALNGKTKSDEKSIGITISEAILSTSLDGSVDQFTVLVNGKEREIVSLGTDILEDRTIVLALKNFLIKSDVISVSYSGVSIQSQSSKTLNMFADLPIINESPDRVVIPDLIQMEDFDFMIGMALEDCTDEGEGKNLNYTDAGDYADYSIYVPKTGVYGIQFRIAGFSEGQIGLYSVDKNAIESELVLVSTTNTGGWQTWETVSGNLSIEEGTHKLRMRILAGGFNFNWMEFGQADSDKDGVLDNVDVCPNTPENSVVDVTGCALFSIPADNYSITASSETCRSQNNGSIVLSAAQNNNYTVALTGNSSTVTENFTSEVGFANLSAGSYNVCITIDGEVGYKQCFSVLVIEPDQLVVSTSRKDTSKKINISLGGGASYYITLNEETFITTDNEIELSLLGGMNKLSVKTSKECQGVFNEEIMVSKKPLVYPNPIKGTALYITNLGFDANVIPVEIYDMTGHLLFSKTYPATTTSLKIDMDNMPKGLCLVRITTAEKVFNYKILK